MQHITAGWESRSSGDTVLNSRVPGVPGTQYSSRGLGTRPLRSENPSGRLLKLHEEGLTPKRSARARVFPEFGERIVVLKQEGTAICDVGQHVRWHSQSTVLPLADKSQPRACSDALARRFGQERASVPPKGIGKCQGIDLGKSMPCD